MKAPYRIEAQEFITDLDLDSNSISVKSVPRQYSIDFVDTDDFNWINTEFANNKHCLVLVDENIKNNYSSIAWPELCYTVTAIEQNKNINKVLEICDWLLSNRANRGSMLYVIGGGILQDLGAFSGAMYKRGIPWTFVPTTLLSQADSCLGAKTAVNHGASKNVLGLFSAPRRVIIDPKFIDSLNYEDFCSGGGEIFRLLTTGGLIGVNFLTEYLDRFLKRDKVAVMELTKASLLIKQSIVEHDEFELDIRRSMNYGHSIGHAIEALSNYRISHGTAVAFGILVENQISVNRNLLSTDEALLIQNLGTKLIPEVVWQVIKTLNPQELLPYLTNDKKAEGNNLKLATLVRLGDMKFLDLTLDQQGIEEVVQAFNYVVK